MVTAAIQKSNVLTDPRHRSQKESQTSWQLVLLCASCKTTQCIYIASDVVNRLLITCSCSVNRSLAGNTLHSPVEAM
jgi:hypothetical protein